MPDDPNRYYDELSHKFEDIVKVVLYCISFFFLALHLLHGFASSFKSLGTDSRYYYSIDLFTKVYAIGIPLGFCFIAIFHLISNFVTH